MDGKLQKGLSTTEVQGQDVKTCYMVHRRGLWFDVHNKSPKDDYEPNHFNPANRRANSATQGARAGQTQAGVNAAGAGAGAVAAGGSIGGERGTEPAANGGVSKVSLNNRNIF